MTKNFVTTMKVRAIEPNKYGIVLTYKNGDKIGCLVSEARIFEIIDKIPIR